MKQTIIMRFLTLQRTHLFLFGCGPSVLNMGSNCLLFVLWDPGLTVHGLVFLIPQIADQRTGVSFRSLCGGTPRPSNGTDGDRGPQSHTEQAFQHHSRCPLSTPVRSGFVAFLSTVCCGPKIFVKSLNCPSDCFCKRTLLTHWMLPGKSESPTALGNIFRGVKESTCGNDGESGAAALTKGLRAEPIHLHTNLVFL